MSAVLSDLQLSLCNAFQRATLRKWEWPGDEASTSVFETDPA